MQRDWREHHFNCANVNSGTTDGISQMKSFELRRLRETLSLRTITFAPIRVKS
ncbi:predicted protein [Botrytis cinerea T4]|uniref:Uncharacterized protein n=1 Tax=Botryotinia fuckeliana (strain T4) TaxID=999810 RepID=G2XUP4_BOTF4|nr:predicted protein [Botrytis cinerea T4]